VGSTLGPTPDSVGPAGLGPEYCDDPAQPRPPPGWARQRLQQQAAGQPDPAAQARPVDAARQRASEIGGLVAGMMEQQQAAVDSSSRCVRTAGDRDAAEAQIESVTAEGVEVLPRYPRPRHRRGPTS
jgi:hypothetical protein